MKVVHFVDCDIYDEILNGGIQVERRNQELLEKSVGKNNVYIIGLLDNCKNSDRYYEVIPRAKGLEDAIAGVLGYRRMNPFNKKLYVNAIKRLMPDLIFLDGSEYGILIRDFSTIKHIAFFHNIEVDYIKKIAINQRRVQAVFRLYAAWKNELITVKKCNSVICLNDRDGNRLLEKYKRKPDLILPVAFKDRFIPTKVERNISEKRLLFVGSLFPPNLDGIKWFIDNVMSELPEFSLTIVGRGFEHERNTLERHNVEVIGGVSDLDEYYYRYSSIVLPILYGSGMKVKTAEALMFGLNIFGTDEAFEGYSVDTISEVFRCNSKQEFISSIRQAYEEKQIQSISHGARNSFLKNNEFSMQVERFQELLSGEK